MREEMLHYIWKFQNYNHSELQCTKGNQLAVIHPGIHNRNQGPDFSDAKIKINDTVWAGNIEMHIRSSDWKKHHHSKDSNYNNIVLHVVWNHDEEIIDNHGNHLPTLELQNRVSKLLLAKYLQLMELPSFIACEKSETNLSDIGMTSWKHRVVAERLLLKSESIFKILEETKYHWEETFWWLIAANFGLKINSDSFRKIAQSIPLPLLARHKNSIIQLEAFLFGQAGLLQKEFKEDYPCLLKKEYEFLRKKYGLEHVQESLHFLRMRPANFPTIRLAQLAMLLHNSEHLFSKIKETTSTSELKKMFEIHANDYWHYHYIFGEKSEFKIKRLGVQMINNILINTVVPIVFSYGLHHDDERYKEKAIRWLAEIPSENNHITTGFEKLGYSNKNAFDSQAFIQLKNHYCEKKQCLECAIGVSILKKT